MNRRLVVIDDEADICELIKDVAEGIGFDVWTTTAAEGFKANIGESVHDVIVLDLNMPEFDGIEILRYLGEAKCLAGVVLVSGSDTRVLTTASRLGVSYGLNMLGTLQKPIKVADLEKTLEQVKLIAAGKKITEGDLRAAIEGGELVVHYQPKINLRGTNDWDFTACEAVVRWNHPTRGMVFPDAFIPLAERTGLIMPLTDWVIDSVLDQIPAWQNKGLSLGVAVNIASQMLNNLKLPDTLFTLLAAKDLKPSRLILEITETGAMSDVTRAMDILTRFRLKGFGLSLDDFGTGYSSLVQLSRMPFNEMKIDKSFVMKLDQEEEARVIARAIIDLAHNLGLHVCAEGVETQESLAWLRDAGCDIAQGYYIGKPMPAAEIPSWREQWAGQCQSKSP